MAEENKAIEKLKSYKELFSKGYCKDCNELCVIDNFPSKDLENNIDTLLNLIKKLQKENEELRVQGSIILLDYNILKDKINEKIKELEEEAEDCRKKGCENIEDFDNCCVEILKELLEEE